MKSKQIEAVLDAFVEEWPKVYLPDHYGTGSPDGENAYRFLTNAIWSISTDEPDEALPVLDRLLTNQRYNNFHDDLKSIRTAQLRTKALRDFEPPPPLAIVDLLDCGSVVTVSALRAIIVEELAEFQSSISGGEFNSANRFYDGGKHLDEVRCTEIIAERLNLRLQPQNITITPEHQLKNAKRSDFTATKIIEGRRRLLVTEVKGQWHNELYTAAAAQLAERYSIHPDAEQQGIFLVIWFGSNVKVAGLKRHKIKNASELRQEIIREMPEQLRNLIDVFVLDVSRE
jgi:hypothetical protein